MLEKNIDKYHLDFTKPIRKKAVAQVTFKKRDLVKRAKNEFKTARSGLESNIY